MDEGGPDFSQRTRTGEGYAAISMAGELDLSVKPAVDAEIRQLLERAELGALILDLRELDFIDSSGIHTLVLAHRECAASGRRLIVLRGGEQVMRILSLCALDVRLTLVDDLEQALAMLARGNSGAGSAGDDESERGVAA